MNDNLVEDIKNTIKLLKSDITEKQLQFDLLLERFQELSNDN